MDRKEFMELVFTGAFDCNNSYVNKLSLIKIYNWHLKEIAKAEEKARVEILNMAKDELGLLHPKGTLLTVHGAKMLKVLDDLIEENKGDE